MTPKSFVRRYCCKAVALSLVSVSLALGAAGVQAQTINAVMHAPLRALDPVMGTPYILRNYGYMVYDTLLAQDADGKVQPQMASWKVSADGKTYSFTLRDGLKWHDGTAVTAADCVASVQRWAKFDKLGSLMNTLLADTRVTGEKTFDMSFSVPTAIVLRALSKPSGVVPFMMQKSVIDAAGAGPITTTVGSGPFKFVAADYKPGVQAMFARNTDYVPRSEPASGLAGGKVVKVDKVKWITMPDAMTAVNAIGSGEIDFIEFTPHDLLPIIEANPALTITAYKKQAFQNMVRMNFTQPPFNNVKIRQAALLALGQKQLLEAQIGNPKMFSTCAAAFGCGSTYASTYGADKLIEPQPEKAKALLKEAGYDNTPVVVMHVTDVINVTPMGPVITQQLRNAGFNVQMQAMDWATLMVRRASRAPSTSGGWSLFSTSNVLPEVADPMGFAPVAANGENAYAGWPDIPALEALRGKLARSADPAESKKIAEEMDHMVIDEVLYVPMGEWAAVTTKRKGIDGQVDASVPVFWNMTKAGK